MCLFLSTSYAAQKPLKIKFILDKEYDQNMIFTMFKSNDPSGLESRAKRMGFDLEFAKRIKEAQNYDDVKDELSSLVDRTYKKEIKKIKRSEKDYTKSWQPIVRQFSDQVVALTGHNWFYDEYLCVVSAFHPGISNWYGNKIVRKYNEDPIKQRWTTAFEIVLSHVFHIVRQSYTTDQLSDWQVWAFSEVTTMFILTTPEMIKAFWPSFELKDNYFSTSNYPQLATLESKLKLIWEKRKDFDDYLRLSTPVLKKFTKTHRDMN